jgi:hypothetical protein
MAGMPNTRQLNGGWGADHPGNIENQNKTKSLLQQKRDSFIQDPQDRRNQGKMKIDETDNVPGFLKDKLSRNGSLSTASTGLCLEGEEDGEIPPDGTFYGMKDGKRGWYPVQVQDPNVANSEKKGDEIYNSYSTAGVSAGGMFAWNEATKTMGRGGVMVGRTWIEATLIKGELEDGEYWLKIKMSNMSATAEVVTQREDITSTDSYIPIYVIADGKISADFRGAFVVPCWE